MTVNLEKLEVRKRRAARAVDDAHNQGWLEGYAQARLDVAEIMRKEFPNKGYYQGSREAIEDWINDR